MSAKSTALVPIIDKDFGGLIVVAGPDSLGLQTIIGKQGPDLWDSRTNTHYRRPMYVYAVVNEYRIDGQLLYAALFHDLGPDHYHVYRPGESAPDDEYITVTVPPGVVVQATFVQPQNADRTEQDNERFVLIPRRQGNVLGGNGH